MRLVRPLRSGGRLDYRGRAPGVGAATKEEEEDITLEEESQCSY